MSGLPGDRVLTPRRLEVLRLAANGRTNLEIAQALWLAEDSVKSHMRLIYEVLGARDRAHAVAIGLVRGLVRPDEVELPPPRAPEARSVPPRSRTSNSAAQAVCQKLDQ